MEDPPAVAGELLVGYRPGTSPSARADARSEASARFLEDVVAGRAGRAHVERVETPAGMPREAAIRRLENHPAVAYAEPNWILTADATGDPSTDPAYSDGSLWGMYGDTTTPANQYGSQAGEAWAAGATGSPDVVVGVIDTGVDISHPDLAANIWTNPLEAAGSAGVDDDKNGYADDVNGWDFYNGDATVYDVADDDDHGTHVAGTIAGVGGDGIGVAGVAWSAKVIPVKFLGPDGGTTANAAKAVDYLTDLKVNGGIDVVASNNSWGGGGYTQTLYDAIERANGAGTLFVAAAGNGGSDSRGDNNDRTPRYPSSYSNSNIIAVALITSSGARSSFSNYGSTSVDLGAPGSGIYSTLPGNTYGTYNGTSMATPHVTGGAALAAAAGISGDEAIKNAILDAAVPTSSMSSTVTKGRLDVSGFFPASLSVATAVDDTYVSAEDVPLQVGAEPGVLDNDTNALSAELASEPSNGTVTTFGADGSFTYTPAPDFAGTDSFTYRGLDASGVASAPASVTITVAGENDAPVGSEDSYTTNVGRDLRVNAPGVLSNDTDVDSEPSSLSAVVEGSVTNGTVQLAEDGSFTFTPKVEGPASFQYRVSDGTATSGPVTVSIDVRPASTDTSTATIDSRPFGGGKHLDILVRVVDSAGNAVAGATVTATIEGTARTATTDSAGVAVMSTYRNVRSGTCYDVVVTDVTSTPPWDDPEPPVTGEICG